MTSSADTLVLGRIETINVLFQGPKSIRMKRDENVERFSRVSTLFGT